MGMLWGRMRPGQENSQQIDPEKLLLYIRDNHTYLDKDNYTRLLIQGK